MFEIDRPVSRVCRVATGEFLFQTTGTAPTMNRLLQHSWPNVKAVEIEKDSGIELDDR